MRLLQFVGIATLLAIALLVAAALLLPSFYRTTSHTNSDAVPQTTVGVAEAAECSGPATSVTVPADGTSVTAPFRTVDGCQEVTFRASSGRVGSAGAASANTAQYVYLRCIWDITGTIGGVDIDTFTVVDNYTLAPYSNISDWQNPPIMTHELSPVGAILYTAKSTSGFTWPEADFSPGIHAQIYVSAQTGLNYPRVGTPLSQYVTRFDGHINSPGYLRPDCTGSFTISKQDFVTRVIQAVGDFFGFCSATRLC